MTRTLLVVPTGHGVGLTATCLGLVDALRRRGVRVGFSKPLAQPQVHRTGADRSTALITLTSGLRPPEPIPAEQVERWLSENALNALMEQAVAAAEPVIAQHDVVILEGLVPGRGLIYASRVNVALAKAFDADVLLVGAGSDDPVEHLAESMAITAQTYQASEHARVVGALVNRIPSADQAAVEVLRKALAERGLQLVGAVPFRPELTWPRVRDLVADLEISVLNEGQSDRRVTDVIIAAQAVPGILPLLREGALVIVPGDRHDVILSVCLAAMNGTRLAGLLLTIGIEPDPRVWQLCRPAADTGLPVLLTTSYSYETATAVYSVDPEVPVDDAERATLVMSAVAEALDSDWLATLPTVTHVPRLTPPAFRHRLTTAARLAARRILLPEGAEPRTLQAAVICSESGIARCVLLARPVEVAAQAARLGLGIPPEIEIIDPTDVDERYVRGLVEARRHKGMTPEMARDQLSDPITLGTMMLRLDEVDGMVAGAVHTTAATLRPALQLLGTAPSAALVSSIFFMCLPDEVVIYGDCAVNPDPDAVQLADIALQSAASARKFGIEPRVAMISFSTGTSGSGTDVAKVSEATRLIRERDRSLIVDGPLQYDAATTASVAHTKAPGSPVAGRATVFVFPDLNTGNTTYKAVQRSADVVSIGPVLQGLAKPVNDLSRGALVDDIVYTIAITAIQAAHSG
ncbi:MAG: phosphate acetyltransferase [Pseudonocardiales bacterium]|nr:phosphate acetyltransferase [Pseudonocardiales bacterium]